MEAAGQRQLVASAVLPREKGDQAEYEALGFTFGAVVDDLFQEATLPPGWSKRGTDHDMHFEVVDERGIARVSVFYKAAFYDRRASMYIVNVGSSLAKRAIYGDGPVSGPWDRLTAEELAGVLESARRYLARADEDPDIFGERVPRAQAVIEAVTKATR